MIYRYTGAFLKLHKIAQSQSTLDKWVNFAFRARLNSFTTKQVPRPQSSRAAGSGETAQSKAFGDLLDEQGRSEAAIECLRKTDDQWDYFRLSLCLVETLTKDFLR